MSKPTIPLRRVIEVSGAAVAGTAFAGYLPWVDLRPYGNDMQWNGFGTFTGPAGYGAQMATLVNPLAWVIVVAVAIGGIALIGSTRNMGWLRFAALGFVAIAVATAALCLLKPDVLVGDLLTAFGIEALGARAVVDTSWLWGELALTSVFLLSIVGIIVAERRTPPAAQHSDPPAPHL